jgi:hypothetical protein
MEMMPTDACQYFYECTDCGTKLQPKSGDCCVFCSYGSVPCPPMQAERATLTSTPVRAIIWTLALVWMGTACILNSKRCGRTHCRYTGPYYLIMVVPVLAFGLASFGICQWIALGVVIVVGSKLIWWASERAWGKFSVDSFHNP